jgi:hypothetical protein
MKVVRQEGDFIGVVMTQLELDIFASIMGGMAAADNMLGDAYDVIAPFQIKEYSLCIEGVNETGFISFEEKTS